MVPTHDHDPVPERAADRVRPGRARGERPPNDLVALQRSAGNRAVGMWLREASVPVQRVRWRTRGGQWSKIHMGVESLMALGAERLRQFQEALDGGEGEHEDGTREVAGYLVHNDDRTRIGQALDQLPAVGGDEGEGQRPVAEPPVKKRRIEAEKEQEAEPDRGKEEEDHPGPAQGTHDSVLPPAVLQWMTSDPRTKSEYSAEYQPDRVRVIPKEGELNSACYVWALQAVQGALPTSAEIWQWLQDQKTGPAWLTVLAGDLIAELQSIANDMAGQQLFTTLADLEQQDTSRTRITRRAKQMEKAPAAAARDPNFQDRVDNMMRRACEAIVRVHGFTITQMQPTAWVVCQYKIQEGAAHPEHWWVEVASGKVIVVVQTVTGKNIEIGGTDLRWHHEDSARGRGDAAASYRLIRIPVRGLTADHARIITAGMRAELDKATHQS